MECAEPAVDGNQPIAEIHPEILVMQVVDVGVAIDGMAARDLNFVKADMTGHRTESCEVQLVDRD